MAFTVYHSLTDEPYADSFSESERIAAFAYAKDISLGMPYAVFVRQDDTTVVMVALHGNVSPAGENPYDTARSMRNRHGDQRTEQPPPKRRRGTMT